MSRDGGHIELDRAVESIRVGRRHRTGLGDLDSLDEKARERETAERTRLSIDELVVARG